MLFQFGEVVSTCFEWSSNLFYFVDNLVEFLDLFDPLVDVHLISIYVTLNNCNIIDYFLGLARHDFNFPDQISLMFHVQLLQVENEFFFVTE